MQYLKSYVTLVLVLLSTCAEYVKANEQLDTLSTFITNQRVYFSFASSQLMVQKISVATPKLLKTIAVETYGLAGGTFRLRIFGHEGGATVPYNMVDLCPPINVVKSIDGIENIWIPLLSPIAISNNDIFVAFDSLSKDVSLLSEDARGVSYCSVNGVKQYTQYISDKFGSWYSYDFPVCLRAVVQSVEQESVTEFVVDTTSFDTHIRQGDPSDNSTELCTTVLNGSLSCIDVNRDGFLDVLYNNRLYINNAGKSFSDETISSNITHTAKAHVFLDANNDGFEDILFIGLSDSSSANAALLLNNTNGLFTSTEFTIESIEQPISVCVADINNDGYLDVFVGQTGTSDSIASQVLLVNDKRDGFITQRLNTSRLLGCGGASFYDIDQDGDNDLIIIDSHNSDIVELENDGAGHFKELRGITASSNGLQESSCAGRGCHVRDIDADGRYEVLSPVYISACARKPDQNTCIRNAKELILGIEYEEMHSGGVFGDIDNDGFVDCIVTTSCECRYADVYHNCNNEKYLLHTSAFALDGIANTQDAVWADLDNDGRLDLLLPGQIVPRFYRQKNNGKTGNYVTLLLDDPKHRAVAGSTVKVFFAGKVATQSITSGRGLLMQDPANLHFGIGDASMIDSIIVDWVGANALHEKFTNVAVNTYTTLHRDNGQALSSNPEVITNIKLFPNPFSKSCAISFDLAARARVSIEIYTSAGSLVRTMTASEYLSSGSHELEWDGMTSNIAPAASGDFIVKIVVDGKIYARRLVHY